MLKLPQVSKVPPRFWTPLQLQSLRPTAAAPQSDPIRVYFRVAARSLCNHRWNAAEMSGNGSSAVGLLSYETLVHAVAGAVVSKSECRTFQCERCVFVSHAWFDMFPLCSVYSVLRMTVTNSCFLREAPQPWPSSSLWTRPKADCRVSIASYHVGQRLPDSSYTTIELSFWVNIMIMLWMVSSQL